MLFFCERDVPFWLNCAHEHAVNTRCEWRWDTCTDVLTEWPLSLSWSMLSSQEYMNETTGHDMDPDINGKSSSSSSIRCANATHVDQTTTCNRDDFSERVEAELVKWNHVEHEHKWILPLISSMIWLHSAAVFIDTNVNIKDDEIHQQWLKAADARL